MDLRDSWKAAWERKLLHISGTTDLYPNVFREVGTCAVPSARDAST